MMSKNSKTKQIKDHSVWGEYYSAFDSSDSLHYIYAFVSLSVRSPRHISIYAFQH